MARRAARRARRTMQHAAITSWLTPNATRPGPERVEPRQLRDVEAARAVARRVADLQQRVDREHAEHEHPRRPRAWPTSPRSRTRRPAVRSARLHSTPCSYSSSPYSYSCSCSCRARRPVRRTRARTRTRTASSFSAFAAFAAFAFFFPAPHQSAPQHPHPQPLPPVVHPSMLAAHEPRRVAVEVRALQLDRRPPRRMLRLHSSAPIASTTANRPRDASSSHASWNSRPDRDRRAVDRERRRAARHPHRREHPPREPLVVRVAVREVVAQRQQQLHEHEHDDEATAPGRAARDVSERARASQRQRGLRRRHRPAAAAGGRSDRRRRARPRGIGARVTTSPASSDATGVAVEVQHGVADDRGHARPGRQDADEVQRIGRRDAARLGRRAPGCARARSSSSASGSANCSPTKPVTNRPPRISPRASSRRSATSEVAPRRQAGLAREQVAEHDAVAVQQLARRRLGIDVLRRAPPAAATTDRPRSAASAARAPGRPRSRVRARLIASCHLRHRRQVARSRRLIEVAA